MKMRWLINAVLIMVIATEVAEARVHLFRGRIRAAVGRMFMRSADRSAARHGFGHGYYTGNFAMKTFGGGVVSYGSSGGCSTGSCR